MTRKRTNGIVSLALFGALLALAHPAQGQSSSDLDAGEQKALLRLQHSRASHRAGDRGGAGALKYEQEEKTGGLHAVGSVFMHQDNTNLSPGNLWFQSGLNSDPSGQWPGNSGIEYFRYMTLLVAGKDKDGIRREDSFDKIRGELADFAITRVAYEGILGGRRDVDDDGDLKIDEDFLNGKDDDGDGRVDEDFAATSPDMLADEMLDYTPEAIGDPSYTEPHVAFGLKVQLTSFAWSTPGGNDFIGIHYDIKNDTRQFTGGAGRDIDSIYVGHLFRFATGPRIDPNSNSDDLVGAMEVAANGKTLPEEFLNDPQHPERAAREDSILHIYYGVDNDGDLGLTVGAGAYMVLGATKFPRLGFKANLTADDVSNDEYGNAPRHMSVHSFRIFRNGIPYAQGGRPTTGGEYYDAMSNKSKATVEFPDLDNTAVYRNLASVGPFIKLAPDSSISFDVAFAVGKVDYSPSKPFPANFTELREFQNKFGTGAGQLNMFSSCLEAWRAWRGGFVASPKPLDNGFKCAAVNDPRNPGGTIGRETCILSALGKQNQYHDCRDQEGDLRETSDLRCTWFDLDCDAATGVCNGGTIPVVYKKSWLGSAPPVPPKVSLRALDHAVQVTWNDLSEKVADPGSRLLDFKGYRLYRAVGWKRDGVTGQNGPANDLWQLVGDWALDSPTPAAAGFLWQVRDTLGFPGSAESSIDAVLSCDLPVASDNVRCHVHKVGWYKYVDRNVINGFRYFYVVTAYDQNDKSPAAQNSPLDKFESQETGRSATEDKVIVTRTDCSPDVDHVKLVPNPYRFKASWDLVGNGPDPTGTHVNFNHLPCGKYTLRIFGVAGDLIQTFHESDAKDDGGTIEWNLVSRNGQDIKAGIYVYSIESAKFGHTVGRFTVIR